MLPNIVTIFGICVGLGWDVPLRWVIAFTKDENE